MSAGMSTKLFIYALINQLLGDLGARKKLNLLFSVSHRLQWRTCWRSGVGCPTRFSSVHLFHFTQLHIFTRTLKNQVMAHQNYRQTSAGFRIRISSPHPPVQDAQAKKKSTVLINYKAFSQGWSEYPVYSLKVTFHRLFKSWILYISFRPHPAETRSHLWEEALCCVSSCCPVLLPNVKTLLNITTSRQVNRGKPWKTVWIQNSSDTSKLARSVFIMKSMWRGNNSRCHSQCWRNTIYRYFIDGWKDKSS